jgi:hypothetical protein
MNRRTFLKTVPAVTLLVGTASGSASDLQPIMLLKPQTEGGKSVLATLWQRKTNRNISNRQLPPQVLSNLLWAAFGINRETASFGKPGRTAPSASNSQEIDLYVALPEGVYLYEAIPHRLKPIVAGDFRARSNRRAATKAPVNIFYVADLSRYEMGPQQPDRSIGDPKFRSHITTLPQGLLPRTSIYSLPLVDWPLGFITAISEILPGN